MIQYTPGDECFIELAAIQLLAREYAEHREEIKALPYFYGRQCWLIDSLRDEEGPTIEYATEWDGFPRTSHYCRECCTYFDCSNPACPETYRLDTCPFGEECEPGRDFASLHPVYKVLA